MTEKEQPEQQSEKLDIEVLVIGDSLESCVYLKHFISDSDHYHPNISIMLHSEPHLEKIAEHFYHVIFIFDDSENSFSRTLIADINNTGARRPIILVARNTENHSLSVALDMGCVDYLPVEELTISMLQRAMRYALTIDKVTEELEQSHYQIEMAMYSIIDGVITLNNEGSVTYVNRTAERLLGVNKSSLLYQPISDDMQVSIASNKASTWCNFSEFLEKVKKNEIHSDELELVKLRNHKSGDKEFDANIHQLQDSTGKQSGMVLTLHDTSDAQVLAQQLAYQAAHDALTKLPNRESFFERLEQAIAYSERYRNELAVFFIDLDGFKEVNDQLGHNYGDEVLKEVAKRLSNNVRATDVVARLGGDEFTVLLTHVSGAESAAKVASNILGAFQDPFMLNGRAFEITASIGITMYPDDGNNKDDLVKNADIAMYRVKKSGRNNFLFFKPDFHEAANQHLRLLDDFRVAFERSEFVLDYQPQVDLQSDQIVAFEAYVRWKHPIYGTILPSNFIPLAIDNNIIDKLGEEVLRIAATEIERWHTGGLPNIKLCLNMSSKQLYDPGLVDDFIKAFEKHHIAPGSIEVEITESIFDIETAQLIESLTKLKKIGVSIALDDFGLGHSKLSLLNQLPIDILKIDKSLIELLPNDVDAQIIVKTIMAMANQLKLKVVAEGVTIAEQVEFLKSIGCNFGQGYYFAKPMSVSDTDEFLNENTKRLAPRIGDIKPLSERRH